MTEPSDEDLFADRSDPEARRLLAERHDDLVQKIAWRFRGRGIDLDDLVQVGRYGLVNAIDRFDPERGVRFTTFAGRTIVGEIKHHFRDHAWSIRVPRSLKNLWLRTSDAVGTLSQKLGRSPTIAELAAFLDEDEDAVLEALDAGGGMSTTSLDKPVGGEGTPAMVDLVGHRDRAIEQAPQWAELEPVIGALDERERTIIALRFFEGRTQQEIADVIGVSQVHVSRLIRDTLAHVRSEIVGA